MTVKKYSKEETMKLLNISKRTLYRYVSQNKLHLVGNGVDSADVEVLLDKKNNKLKTVSNLSKTFNMTRYKMQKLLENNSDKIECYAENNSRTYYNIDDVEKVRKQTYIKNSKQTNYNNKLFLMQLWRRKKSSNSEDWLCRPVFINQNLSETIFRTNTGLLINYNQVLLDRYFPSYPIVKTNLDESMYSKKKNIIYLKFTWNQVFQVQYKQVLDFFLANFRKNSISVSVNENVILKVTLNVKSSSIQKKEWIRLNAHSKFKEKFSEVFMTFGGLKSTDVTFKEYIDDDEVQVELLAKTKNINLQISQSVLSKLESISRKHEVNLEYTIAEITAKLFNNI
ncbi:helix-turn-helix domain-containing protein [Lactiplantibacillus plantarum]|uniref:helix-turn-helix domain-containing protein n=1 Tax=Lactiplantibacillus plantarum TaxID=1590 RepID=UPI001BA4EB99|nr:helix-turn-helix domain-containing protein [Lactiplantibacillus plantarum]MBS0954989.1 helix-turn-helix domain-containing protein [Lactiplantibacillus plantarum]